MSNPNKIIVEILVGTRGMMDACVGCVAGGCGGTEDYAVLTEKAAGELRQQYGDLVDVRYVDIGQVGLDGYPKVKNVLAVGYRFPITVINGEPRLAGGVSLNKMKEIVEKTIAEPSV